MSLFGRHAHNSMDPTDPGTHEVREAPGYRLPVKKPAAVTAAAERANAMISRIASGDRAGAEALVTDADRARRKGEASRRDPEYAARVLAAAGSSDGTAHPRTDPLVAFQGREMRLSEAVRAGYQTTGNEGKADPETGA